jgi:prepilin-type N-terminal cleavage/methylation domain-containing protein
MSRLRQEDGFTLMEMLISMVVAVVLFGAVLTALDGFTHTWQATNLRFDAQDKARLGIDRIVRQLRNIASPLTTPKLLERATPYDLVFQTVGTPSGSNLTGAERVRYCIPSDTNPGTAADEVLIGETQTWSTATPPASPWSSDPSATVPCPDSSPPAGVGNPVTLASGVTNRYQGRTDRQAFSYNNGTAPSDLGQVFTVQIDLFVNPTPSVGTDAEIRSGAFLRNQPRAPVPHFTYTPTGGGGVLLNGGTSYSPDGENLSFAWACTAPAPCPQSSALASSTTALVQWQPGAGTYTVQLTVTDQTGLVKTDTEQVPVT